MARGNNCHRSREPFQTCWTREETRKDDPFSYFLNQRYIYYAVASFLFFLTKNLFVVLLVVSRLFSRGIINHPTQQNTSILRCCCADVWCMFTKNTFFRCFWLVLIKSETFKLFTPAAQYPWLETHDPYIVKKSHGGTGTLSIWMFSLKIKFSNPPLWLILAITYKKKRSGIFLTFLFQKSH